MNMKHSLEEMKAERDSLKKECSDIKSDLISKEREWISMKQNLKFSQLGIDLASEDSSKLIRKVQEQK